MKNILLLLIPVFLFSCSAEKKIARFVKKEGAKPVATFIAVHYPEYLKADTIRYVDTITVTKVIKVPELIRDTVYATDTINDCKSFSYRDNILQLDISGDSFGKTKVRYKIFERQIKDTVTVYIDKEIPCPPCPTITVVQEVVKQNEIALAEQKGKLSFFRNGFWILLCILLGIIGWKFLRVAGKV